MHVITPLKPNTSRKGRWSAVYWMIVILLGLSLAACSSTPADDAKPTVPSESNSPVTVDSQTASSPGETDNPKESSSPEANPPSDAEPEAAPAENESPEQIQAKWEAGPHAHTYVLDSAGKNDTCARCHAPVNWIPSMDDMPESCYACKFEVKPAPPLISESTWTHVECKICHEIKKKEVQPEISWLEIAQIEQYAAVASATELCLKCHAPVEVAGHAGINNGGAHAAMACNECHDAHSMTASCSEAGCHGTLDAPGAVIAGHDADHANVTCSACHDSSGLEVGPDAEGFWVTFHPSPAEGTAEGTAFTSHNTVRAAPCERCHFAENPWGLNLVETGASGD